MSCSSIGMSCTLTASAGHDGHPVSNAGDALWQTNSRYPVWRALCGFVADTSRSQARIAFSACVMAPQLNHAPSAFQRVDLSACLRFSYVASQPEKPAALLEHCASSDARNHWAAAVRASVGGLELSLAGLCGFRRGITRSPRGACHTAAVSCAAGREPLRHPARPARRLGGNLSTRSNRQPDHDFAGPRRIARLHRPAFPVWTAS